MRHSLHLSAALVAGLIGQSPAVAQTKEIQEQVEQLLNQLREKEKPKAEGELKRAQEQLERLLQQLRDKESKRGEGDRKPVPKPPTPPAAPGRPLVWTVPAHGDATGALKALTQSKDPRVAAKAKELLELVAQVGPKPGAEGAQLKFHVVPGVGAGKPIELKFGAGQSEVRPTEKRIVVVGEGAKIAEHGGFLELKLGEDSGQQPKKGVTVVRAVAKPGMAPKGTSSLKLSADGKTAAVVGTDGSVTIYDVASGKELMKFDGK